MVFIDLSLSQVRGTEYKYFSFKSQLKALIYELNLRDAPP